MKRLLALFLLAVTPAFAQELPPTYVNSGNIINSTYPSTYGFVDGVAPFEQVGIGGVVMDPDDWDGDGFYYQFSFMPGAIIAEIDISALQLNSLEVFITSFAFKTDCNNSIGGSCENPMGPQDWIRSRMELFTSEGLFGSYNMFNSGDGTFYSYTGADWVGAFNYVNKDMVDLTSETAYFTSARLIVEGQDMGFWGGLYGPKIDSLNLQIEYDTALQGLDTPIAPDCTINPNDPTCIINDLIDFTDEEPVMFANTADESMPIDDDEEEEDTNTQEELLASAEPIEEEITSEESLEELLADESADEESLDEEEMVADVKELVNEEKAATLSDSISRDVLGLALSVAADAVALNTTTDSSSSSTSSSSSSTRASSDSSSGSTTTSESSLVAEVTAEQKEESKSSDNAALDILETGRQLGQQALSETLAASDAASTDSLKEAESVAAFSSESSATSTSLVSASTDTSSTDIVQSSLEQVTSETIVVATVEETASQETIVADSSNEISVDANSSSEMNVVETTSAIVEEAEMLADNLLRAPVTESVGDDEALAIVEASRATAEQKTFDDESNKDAETTTALVDPALAMANTFNQPPSMMNLEILGIVKPIEEKSDAEIRAEQVVAANKEQQDAINANYMDADQSGIVAAIGSDADVSSYLSQRLTDVPFYKPEDIYKNIVYKDNVRGAYFLEKGNTDTYKKMVEEQYKDE